MFIEAHPILVTVLSGALPLLVAWQAIMWYRGKRNTEQVDRLTKRVDDMDAEVQELALNQTKYGAATEHQGTALVRLTESIDTRMDRLENRLMALGDRILDALATRDRTP